MWQPADERVTARSKTVHITLLLPLSGVLCLESVMSDKMCVCVCVCVCVCECVCTDSFQLKLGSQIDFSVLSASLFSIFDVSQCTCSQNQCLFPLPLLVPLALLSNVYAATAIISMFSSSRLDRICVVLSCQIRLLFGCLDSEPNTAVNTVQAKSKHHEVLVRSIKKQRCLLCS